METVPQVGWAGLKNGDLLILAEKQFNIYITVDRNLSFQLNLPQFNIAILVLQAATNRLADLKLLVPNVLAMLPTVKVGQIVTISI